jgi:hypothetical protein
MNFNCVQLNRKCNLVKRERAVLSVLTKDNLFGVHKGVCAIHL